MEKFMQAVGFIVLSFLIIFISPSIGVVVGGFVGWTVSIFAPVWVPTGLKLLHINVEANQLVELGSTLGFLGGFFRINIGAKKDK